MTLQQLKYVLALDKERHFARAAEACTVSQPGLTIQLKNLEEEIGIKIFDRSKTPLTPTPLGEEIILRAKKILREADEIRNFVVHQKNDLKGSVTLGVIPTLSPYLVPLFISAMQESTPEMKYIIKEASTLQLIEDLETGVIDAALMATPTGNNRLKEYPVFDEPFVAYLNKSHDQYQNMLYSIENLNTSKLLLLESEYCYNAQLLDICDLKNSPDLQKQFDYEISSIETLKNLVRSDLGFAIVPQLSLLRENDSLSCKPFKDPKPVREISLVVADTYSRKLLLEKMSEAIWKSLPEDLKENKPYRKIRWNDSPYFIKSTHSLNFS